MSEDRQLNVGSATLNFRIDGTGPEPLVCVHGVGSYLEAWSGVVALLAGQFTILTFDLRGHGRSSRVKGRYELDDFVDETIKLADHVGFETFNLAGFSLGGLIAQKLAIDHPQRLRRLVLLATVAGRTPDERARVLARLAALKAGEAGSHYDGSLSRWLTEAFQQQNPELIRAARERSAANDPDCYAAAYRVLAETDLGDQLHRISCPTLIATGEDDIGSNPRMARFMNDCIPGSTLRILPGLRHSILIEAPDLVGSMMQDFLATTPERSK